MVESILRRRPDLDALRLARTRELMCEAVADCVVTGFEPLIDSISLPDEDDRHVVAAAIIANAQAIVTSNLADFPSKALEQYGIEAIHPDDFLVSLIDLNAASVAAAFTDQFASLRNPPPSREVMFDRLIQAGLTRTVGMLKERIR